MTAERALGDAWYTLFNTYAGDLYPGLFTRDYCNDRAQIAFEIWELARKKNSTILAHYYQDPDVQEVADVIGDSLHLALTIRELNAPRVDYSSVHFMAETAKAVVGDKTRIFVQGEPSVHSCSLVQGTDIQWVLRYKRKNPDAVLITYVNSDNRTKALCDYVSTSRNTAAVINEAMRQNPGQRVLVLPDKYLGYVMRAQAHAEYGIDMSLVDVYDNKFGGRNACCYVHEKIGDDAPEAALAKYPNSILMLHPECGCASSCVLKLNQGILPKDRVYYRSTAGMIKVARESSAETFIVGTEISMIYQLRKMLPEKRFVPISADAKCDFMKANSLEKLLESLKEDKYEIVLDDNCDPNRSFIEGSVIKLHRPTAMRAKVAIDRMLAVQ